MDYLAEFDQTAPVDQYPLVKGWIKTEPLAFFKQLRAERPVLVTPVCTLVAGFADVRDMLQMPKVFTVDLYKPKMGVTSPDDGYLMAHDDDALHYREKSLMQGLLNRDDLPHIRKLVEQSAAEILANANGSIEFVNEYCRTVPVRLVQDYFGLDGVDAEDLIEWSYWNQYDAFNNQPIDLLTEEQGRYIVERHDAVSEKLGIYVASLLVRKLATNATVSIFKKMLSYPKRVALSLLGMTLSSDPDTVADRMLSSKFSKDIDFSLLRQGVNAGGLLIGAIETTQQAVAQAVQFFIQHPDLMRQAKQAASFSDTTEFDQLVWEALRFVPIRPDIFRKAGADFTAGKGTDYETDIEKGTIVRLLTLSAMFDPYANKEPDEFNPDRSFYHNFVFGFGPHECLGKYVAMVMVPEMVRQAILMPELSEAGPMSYERKEGPLTGKEDGPFPENYEIAWK